jgi:predicted nucleotidyltransferase
MDNNEHIIENEESLLIKSKELNDKILLTEDTEEEPLSTEIRKDNFTIRELSTMAEKILQNIKEIKNSVEVTIAKNEKDFIGFLESILDKLIKDTKNKINEIEYNFDLTRKKENVKNILKEREFYESEAMRLDKLTKGNLLLL